MEDEENQGVSDENGWIIDATLNRYKKFIFEQRGQATKFMTKTAAEKSPKEIHVEIKPNTLKFFVEIIIKYNPEMENEVRKLMEKFEEDYQLAIKNQNI